MASSGGAIRLDGANGVTPMAPADAVAPFVHRSRSSLILLLLLLSLALRRLRLFLRYSLVAQLFTRFAYHPQHSVISLSSIPDY